LAEAESELVSGFMTEHAAVVFVFFFLAEYASILLMCVLTSILFLGGYLVDYYYLIHIVQYIDFDYYTYLVNTGYSTYMDNNYYSIIDGLNYSVILGIKSAIMVFVFIWVRASFPRIRFDQLMSYC
jgi:NADH-ubiquinone oxidoreductase chain 1